MVNHSVVPFFNRDQEVQKANESNAMLKAILEKKTQISKENESKKMEKSGDPVTTPLSDHLGVHVEFSRSDIQ